MDALSRGDRNMCCEPCGSEEPEVSECDVCGGPTDSEGGSTDICSYSPVECEVCGWAPCDDSC